MQQWMVQAARFNGWRPTWLSGECRIERSFSWCPLVPTDDDKAVVQAGDAWGTEKIR